MMKRRFVALLLFVLAVVSLYWIFREHATLERLIEQESRLRGWVSDFPVASVAIGFVIYVASSLVPGTLGKAVVYGWLFGFWIGLLVVNVALTLAAVVTFLTIRYAFQDYAHAKLGKLIRRVDEALLRHGSLYLLSLRLVGAPYTLTNYVAGATAVPTWTFFWTTQLGMFPANVAFVLAGSQLPSLRQMVRQSPWSLVDLPLLIGLSVAVLLPVGMRWAIQRWRLPASGLRKPGSERSE
jgi:uncharacterized membrane protein YdjX (TVP38/TMEM64 family)